MESFAPVKTSAASPAIEHFPIAPEHNVVTRVIEFDDIYEPVVLPEKASKVVETRMDPDKDKDMVDFVNSAQMIVGNHIGNIMEHVRKTKADQHLESVEEL